jgi:hypothetical protein
VQPEDVVKVQGNLFWKFVPLVGSVVLATAHLWHDAWVKLPIVGGIFLLGMYVVVSEVTTRELRRKDAARDLKRRIETNLTTAVQFLVVARTDVRHVRANVMCPVDAHGEVLLEDEDRSSLKILYGRDDFQSKERRKQWVSGEGCCGEAWDRSTPVLGGTSHAISALSTADALKTDGVHVTEIEELPEPKQQLKTVLSVPVRDEDGRCLGVLNFDDEEQASESALGKSETIHAARELARRIARQMSTAGVYE